MRSPASVSEESEGRGSRQRGPTDHEGTVISLWLAALDRAGDRGTATRRIRGQDHAPGPPAGLSRRPGRDSEQQQAVVGRLLDPWTSAPSGKKPKTAPWVPVGVPESDVFQAVVPITPANSNAPAQSFFLEAVQATNVRAEERIIDMLKLEISKIPVACVAAGCWAAQPDQPADRHGHRPRPTRRQARPGP